ncbi:MAG: glycerophosphodiester phosphodiesterase family protein [Candidatus Glassbacteria bacterium]
MSSEFIVIGHRGAAGLAPENTLASFARAVELGVDMVELDVQLTTDHRLAVIHDETVERTTDGAGRVSELTFARIHSLDAGAGQQVPGLEEVLDTVGRRCRVNVELKGENTGSAVCTLLREYVSRQGWRWRDFLISSFDYDRLSQARELLPEVPIAVLFSDLPDDFLEMAKALKASYVNLSLEQATPERIAAAGYAGLPVLVYTVNSAGEADSLRRIGAAGVFTDYPDLIKP